MIPRQESPSCIRAARPAIHYAGRCMGYLGEVHPDVAG